MTRIPVQADLRPARRSPRTSAMVLHAVTAVPRHSTRLVHVPRVSMLLTNNPGVAVLTPVGTMGSPPGSGSPMLCAASSTRPCPSEHTAHRVSYARDAFPDLPQQDAPHACGDVARSLRTQGDHGGVATREGVATTTAWC